jgi:lauroyl/myristoyl acyltransferase
MRPERIIITQPRATAVALVLLIAWSRIATRRRQQQVSAISASLVTVRCLSALAHLLPTSNAIRLGAFIGRIALRVAPWRRSVLRGNLKRTRAFRRGFASNHSDDDNTHQEAELECRAYEHLGSALLLTLQCSAKVEASLALHADDAQLAAFQADCSRSGVVVTSAHHGLWELLPSVLSRLVPSHARARTRIVYRPLHDRPLDAWLRCRRERSAHVELIPDRGSLGRLRESLTSGGVVGLLCDQRPRQGAERPGAAEGCGRLQDDARRDGEGGDHHHHHQEEQQKEGQEQEQEQPPPRQQQQEEEEEQQQERVPLSVELLGQRSVLSPGLCALHRSTGAPVWFAALSLAHEANGQRAMRLQLVRLAGRDAAVASSTLAARYARAVSMAVVEAPEQYFWWHRRWQ